MLAFSVCTLSYGVYAISFHVPETVDAYKQSKYFERVVK